jgi:signal transduction histidine kinase
LWVKDQGPGVPPELRERIFDQFFRLDDRDGKRLGGTGLGLPLVKEVARIHGGEVRLESRLGEGSTFFLILPPALSEGEKATG